jgi:cation diffusion facilitator family transporter
LQGIESDDRQARLWEFWKMDEKSYAAFSSVVAAIILTITKLIVGVWSGSLGILSEALHSLLDFAAAGVTLFAVRSSDRPADQDHQFGHGKIESLSALFETVLLLITVIWIIYEAVRRIILSELEIITHPITFGVVIFAIIIDYSRSRLLYRMADKYDSEALRADALHFSSDILSSSVVFLGLVFAFFGFPLGDPLAAIGVAIVVLIMTVNLGKKTVDSLLDRAPLGDKEKVKMIAEQVDGVNLCERIRIRKSGATTFIDLTIVINPRISLEEAHLIAENVKIDIQRVIPSADISIHMDPTSEDLIQLIEAIRQQSTYFNWIIDIHRIYAFDFKDILSVGFHIRVEPDDTLGLVHQKLNDFKIQLYNLSPRIQEEFLSIHIEPYRDRSSKALDTKALQKKIKQLSDENNILYNPHGIQIFPIQTGFFISIHCNAQADLTIEEVHDATALLEKAIINEVPGQSEIYIFVEPHSID